MGTEKCELCEGTGVVFTRSLSGRGDKDTCPECGGTGDVEPGTNPGETAPEPPQPVEAQQVDLSQQGAVVPHYQWTNPEVATLRAEVERLKQQYAEEVDEFNAGYQAARDGLGEDAEPFHCPHDVWLCGYAWGKFESLKDEVARLRKIIDDATGHSKDGDGVDLLCKALYGRPGQVPDWLGGSEARMLYDAVEEIEELRAEANALDRLRAWQNRDNNNRCFELDGDYLLLCHITNGEWSCAVLVVAEGTFAEVVDAALARWSDLYEQQ